MNVFKEPEKPSFEKVGIVGRIFESTSVAPTAEFFTVETSKGHETTIRQRECDFFYHVLEGSGCFIIDGEKQNCTVGDLIAIPHGKWFRYEGTMKLFAASVPPWRAEQEDTQENQG
jgi:mannose-6-phosphate isomerase-like protein (cupin superfamily)